MHQVVVIIMMMIIMMTMLLMMIIMMLMFFDGDNVDGNGDGVYDDKKEAKDNNFVKVRVAESGRDYLLHTYLGQVLLPSS